MAKLGENLNQLEGALHQACFWGSSEQRCIFMWQSEVASNLPQARRFLYRELSASSTPGAWHLSSPPLGRLYFLPGLENLPSVICTLQEAGSIAGLREAKWLARGHQQFRGRAGAAVEWPNCQVTQKLRAFPIPSSLWPLPPAPQKARAGSARG